MIFVIFKTNKIKGRYFVGRPKLIIGSPKFIFIVQN